MRSDTKHGDERNQRPEASGHRLIGTAKGRANLARQGLRRVAGGPATSRGCAGAAASAPDRGHNRLRSEKIGVQHIVLLRSSARNGGPNAVPPSYA